MRPIAALLLLFVVLLSSCDKDEEEKLSVYAGVANEGMYHKTLNPPLQLQTYLDTSTNYFFGADSLDLDGNGSIDLHLLTSFGGQSVSRSQMELYDHLTLDLKNGFEVATNLELYNVGLGQTATAMWADTLSYNKKVNDLPSWSETYTLMKMWAVPPDYVIFWGSNGPWYLLENKVKYIAIRKKTGSEFKYGWIEIDEKSREDIRVNSYAIEN